MKEETRLLKVKSHRTEKIWVMKTFVGNRQDRDPTPFLGVKLAESTRLDTHEVRPFKKIVIKDINIPQYFFK